MTGDGNFDRAVEQKQRHCRRKIYKEVSAIAGHYATKEISVMAVIFVGWEKVRISNRLPFVTSVVHLRPYNLWLWKLFEFILNTVGILKSYDFKIIGHG